MLPHHFSRWVLALVIAMVAVGVNFGHAAAAPASRVAKPGANARLTQMYRVAQVRLRVQGERLRRVDLFAGRLDALIAKLQAKGQDTAALEQALASFRGAIEQARGEWNSAKSTLDNHAGFGTGGKVTDADQARATLQAAHQHLEQAHTIAKGALRDLRAALLANRKAHHNLPQVLAPVEP